MIEHRWERSSDQNPLFLHSADVEALVAADLMEQKRGVALEVVKPEFIQARGHHGFALIPRPQTPLIPPVFVEGTERSFHAQGVGVGPGGMEPQPFGGLDPADSVADL